MPSKTSFLKVVFCCGLLLLCGLSLYPGYIRGHVLAQATLRKPTLTIGNVTAVAGSKVTVPVQFQQGASAVETMVFSVDYDQSCLTFNAVDANRDTIPDAITIFAPASLFHWAAFSAADTQGELDFAIISLAALPDTEPLVTIELTTTCASGVAAVTFATEPTPSFGANGLAVLGATINGSVAITAPPVTPPPASSLLLVSVGDASGVVDGVAFQDEDILAYDAASKQWSLLFDGSDVGWAKVDLEAFDVLPDGSLLLTPSKKIKMPGLGEVTPSDIVRFLPTTLGNTTSGTWEWYFDGSDVGLSSSSEYIDALALDPGGRLLISSEGSFDAGGVKGADEDLWVFTKLTLGVNTTGSWALYFDGSQMALTKESEDIDAAWVKPNGDLYLSTKGKFAAVSGSSARSGDQNDLFICQGTATSCTFAGFFDGDAARLTYNIDDMALVAANQLRPLTVVSAAAETSIEQYMVGATAQQNLTADVEVTEDDLDDDEVLSQQVFLPFIGK